MTFRTFLALKVLPGPALLDCLADCRDAFKGCRFTWVRTDHYHLTLRFLGDSTAEQIGYLKDRLPEVVRQIEPFPVQFRSLGVFPDTRRPAVMWVGIRAGQGLHPLRDRVEALAREAGFSPDTKSFAPHLTLARIKTGPDTDLLEDVLEEYRGREFQESLIQELILMESRLFSVGPEYHSLAVFPLGLIQKPGCQ